MANKKDDGSLLGYDPLAWLNAEAATEETAAVSASADSGEAQMDAVAADTGALESASEDTQSSLQQGKLCLQETHTMQNISELREQLLAVLERNLGPIEIDASAVKMIDTSTFQLLIALKQETLRNKRELVFDFPSERFLEAAGLLGATELLALNKSASGFF